jgi:hypothetical protein
MGGFDPHDTGRDRAQLSGEIGLEEAFIRPCGDMPNKHPGGEFDSGRQIRGRGAREDLDGGPGGGDALGGLDDIDIHPAGIACAGLVEG